MLIPTKLHGAADYATGALLLAAPAVLRLKSRRGTLLLRAAGGGMLAQSLVTDYELGVVRKLPMPAHLALDAATGALLAGSPWLLKTRDEAVREWLPAVLAGVGEIAAAALTERRAPGPEAPLDRSPTMPTGATGEGVAAAGPRAGLAPRVAPAPLETPGPSVNAPAFPESDTERAERADALTEPVDEALAPTRPARMEDLAQASPEVLAIVAETDTEPGAATVDPLEALIREQEDAAAAEASGIGGPHHHDADDPALEAVYEAGGGEAEGFELAERDLIENATHGDGHGDPARDAIAPEAESDLASVEYGDPDRINAQSEVDDPENRGH